MANKAGGNPETKAVMKANNTALATIEGLKAISPKNPYKLSCKPPPKKRKRAQLIPMKAPKRQSIEDSANTKSNMVESE